MDSFHLAALIHSLKLPAAPICWDFGAGAGLPGIPLRLLWQEGEYIMVEARKKRVLFLQAVLARLALPGIRVSPCRVEDFMASAAPAHLLLSRAFMPWEKLLALAAGHLAPAGVTIFMASSPAPQLPPSLAAHWCLKEDCHYPSTARPTAHFWTFCSL
jgi:16S rRNA (guanine527-N7)-methyltransferase